MPPTGPARTTSPQAEIADGGSTHSRATGNRLPSSVAAATMSTTTAPQPAAEVTTDGARDRRRSVSSRLTGMGIAEVSRRPSKEWHDGATVLRTGPPSRSARPGPDAGRLRWRDRRDRGQEAFDKVAGKADERAKEMSTASAALGAKTAMMSARPASAPLVGECTRRRAQAPNPAPGRCPTQPPRQQAAGRQETGLQRGDGRARGEVQGGRGPRAAFDEGRRAP